MRDAHGPPSGDDVVERLQALGRHPVPSAVQGRHLAAMAATPGPSGRRGRPMVVLGAVAAALVLIVGGAWLADRDGAEGSRVVLTDGDAPAPEGGLDAPAVEDPAGSDDRDPQDREAPGDTGPKERSSTTVPGATTAPPEGDERPDTATTDPCGGPPPFAGSDPGPPAATGDEEAERQDESDAWEAPDATCAGGPAGEGAVPHDPFPDDPCRGPPPKGPECTDPPTEGPSQVPREG